MTPENGKVVVALCADKNMEAGLHVALLSMLENYSRKDLGIKIYLFLEGFSERDLRLIRETLDQTQSAYDLCVQKVELNVVRSFRSLHGNYMTYAKLFLPDILKDEHRFIYLDSDLVVGTDLYDLYHTKLNNNPIGAVVGGATIGSALERDFFMELGLSADGGYFNAGVLLFDAVCWRANNLTQRCLDFSNRHPSRLRAADQTVLNAILHKSVLDLERRYNVPVYPSTPTISFEETNDQIIHFVGSPKPWDMFGRSFHRNHHVFKRYCDRTALRGHWQLSPRSIYRTLRLSRSYLRRLKM